VRMVRRHNAGLGNDIKITCKESFKSKIITLHDMIVIMVIVDVVVVGTATAANLAAELLNPP
jgi:hypothetical protein